LTRQPSEVARRALLSAAVVALLALAAVAAVNVVCGRGPLGSSAAAREECRNGYRRARTAADSAMVDAWTPVTSTRQAAFAKSCALMRRDGDI
jgi:hypothetical protein